MEKVSEGLKLDESLKNCLFHTGTVLQGMDEEAITFQIRHTMEELEEIINKQRNEVQEKKKVILSCCIMVGLLP